MLHLSFFCVLLALAVAQSGYEYNKPDRQFGSTSSRPGSPGSSGSTSTSHPLRPQSNDFVGPTTGYPTGAQYYPGTSQRPGFLGSSYETQRTNRPSGPRGYPGGPGGSPGEPGRYPGSPSGLQGKPGSYRDGGLSSGPGGYPGGTNSYDNNSIQDSQRSSGGYPGQSDSSYPQGSRGPTGSFPGQGSKYPGQPQNYPRPSGNNLGTVGFADDSGNYEGGDYSAIPGEPDRDYPILSYIPETIFNCKAQQYPGYYADVDTRCQVFHICANNRTYDFLCPNGTVFSQEDFVCVWWNQFSCDSAPGLYALNAKLYDHSIRGASESPVSFQPNFLPSRPREKYPGNFGSQGPTTAFPSITLENSLSGSRGSSGYPGQDGRYPGTQDSSSSKPSSNEPKGPAGNYPGSQGPSGNYPSQYPGSQGPSGNYPSYQGSGSYPNSPQGQSGSPGSSRPGYPSSTTPYPGTASGSQGYPSGRPSGPSFSGGSGGRQPQPPNREYLPPRNKRAEHSKQ